MLAIGFVHGSIAKLIGFTLSIRGGKGRFYLSKELMHIYCLRAPR